VPPNGIDFIDEDDTGGVSFSLKEEVPDPRGSHTDKHFDKVGAADGEKRNLRLPRNGPGQKGLPRSGGTDEKNPLWDSPSQFGKFLRIPEKIDDFFEFPFRLFNAGHVFKGHPVLFLGQDLGFALSKRKGLPAAHLDLPHEKYPDADKKDHWKPGDKDVLPEWRLFLFFGVDDDFLVPEHFDHFRVLRGVSLVPFAIDIFPGHVPAPGLHFKDLVLLNSRDELRIVFVEEGMFGFRENLEKQDHDNENDRPKNEVLIERIQRFFLQVATTSALN
jgi:hypothetical protein